MRILGVDPSLTGAGCALVDTDDVLGTETWTCTSSPSKVPGLAARLLRLDKLADTVLCVDTDLVVIEGPSLGAGRQSMTWERAGLWWLVVERFDRRGVPVVEIPPASLKLYATGKGNAAKDVVLLAVARRYPNVDVTNNNEADALVLAAMGARALGHPIEEYLPKHNALALGGIKWPEIRE